MFSFITEVKLNVLEPTSTASQVSVCFVNQNCDTLGNLSICSSWSLILLWNYTMTKHIRESRMCHMLSVLYHILTSLDKIWPFEYQWFPIEMQTLCSKTGWSEESNLSKFSVRGGIIECKMSCRKQKYWVWNSHSKTGSTWQVRGWKEYIFVVGKDLLKEAATRQTTSLLRTEMKTETQWSQQKAVLKKGFRTGLNQKIFLQ